MGKRLDILEVGGEGGVFQHSVAVAKELSDAGYDVILHTASNCEIEDPALQYCRCFSWEREAGQFRAARIVLRFLFLTLPHLLYAAGPVVWVQGLFKPPLTLLALTALRIRGQRVIFSPHNLFSRSDSKLESRIISLITRCASVNFIYNSSDAEQLKKKKVRYIQLPLIMYAPIIKAKTAERWARILRDANVRVCSIGQIRPDKNLDLLVEACQKAGIGLAIMGEDKGALPAVRAKISGSGAQVRLFEGYYPIEDMAAVVALSGVLALPYSTSSQSGAAGLAHSYGASVVAFNTGGLSEQADVLVNSLTLQEWQSTLEGLSERPRIQAPPDDWRPSVPGASQLIEAVAEAIKCKK